MRHIHLRTVSLQPLNSYDPSRSDSVIAPVLNDVKISYTTKEFNGSFMQESIYRRLGSPEVDKAWEDLGVDCKGPIYI